MCIHRRHPHRFWLQLPRQRFLACGGRIDVTCPILLLVSQCKMLYVSQILSISYRSTPRLFCVRERREYADGRFSRLASDATPPRGIGGRSAPIISTSFAAASSRALFLVHVGGHHLSQGREGCICRPQQRDPTTTALHRWWAGRQGG